jgi:Single-strand binding protein family
MSRAIVSGALHRAVEIRTAKSGNPFATFTIREAINGAARWWRAVAFDEATITALRELDAGAPIACAGEIDCELWTPEDGRDPRLNWKITADTLLTARRPKRRETAREVEDAPAF